VDAHALAHAIGLSSPLRALDTGEPGDLPMLAARAALLVAVAWSGRGPRPRLAVGALFVASLAARGLLLPFAVAALAAAWPSRRLLAAAGGAAIASVVLSVVAARPPAPPPWAGYPAAETTFYVARDNLFRARAAAVRWASVERGAGGGHLALAKIDWQLGHADEARALAADVAARGEDDGLRRRAEDALRAWSP
jgi:hypothetical protein